MSGVECVECVKCVERVGAGRRASEIERVTPLASADICQPMPERHLLSPSHNDVISKSPWRGVGRLRSLSTTNSAENPQNR
jgi:hypothetical protein